MSEEQQISDDFYRLITSLKLSSILPLRIHFDRLGGDLANGSEVNITWNLAYAGDDPIREAGSIIRFRPRFLVTVHKEEVQFFQLDSVTSLAFQIVNQAAFDQAWANVEARKIFLEKQLQKTLWPIIRQQVLDGMTRLGFPGVPLPWITE